MRNPCYTKLVGQCRRLTFARALAQRRSSFTAEIEQIIVTARATEEWVRNIPVATTAAADPEPLRQPMQEPLRFD